MKLTLGGWRRWCHMSSENDQDPLETPLPSMDHADILLLGLWSQEFGYSESVKGQVWFL